MAPSSHARLGASNAHRWMNCLGAPRLSANLPAIEEDYMLEGRAAHALAEHRLLGHEDVATEIAVQTEKGMMPWPVTDEMNEAVKLFTDTVHKAFSEMPSWAPGVPPRHWIEAQVDLSAINPPEPMFGTADVILAGKRALHVFDLKYGRGFIVEVRKAGVLNEQLMYYVLGAVLKIAMARLLDPKDEFVVEEEQDVLSAALDLFDEIRITIVQPRAGHADGPVRTTDVTRSEIIAFADRLMDAAEAAQEPDAPLTPGDWCRFCPAQATCPALKQHAALTAQVDFDAVPLDAPPSPEHLSLAVVADMLTQVPVLEAWISAMYRRVTQELEAGREVPGWKLVNKRATRTWADEAEAMRWMEMSGIPAKEAFDVSLKSPAGIEKIVGKNIPETLVKKESSGYNLVIESDPRPAAAVGPAEEFALLLPGTP